MSKAPCLSILFTICTVSTASSQNFVGPWRVETLSAQGADTVYGADVDGDGDRDVIAGGDDLTWYENVAGDGTVWAQQLIDASIGDSTSVQAADLDGDGDLDVLHSDAVADGVAWYENTAGDGSAWTKHAVFGAFPEGLSAEAADLDGDGDLDILFTQYDPLLLLGFVQWLENAQGDGSTWLMQPIDFDIDAPRAVHAQDVDGDGDLDVLAAGSIGFVIEWYENTAGDGSSWSDSHVATLGSAWDVFGADVDGDGDVDAVSADFDLDRILWHENVSGSGMIWLDHVVTTSADGAEGVFAVDMDGDGDLDVLVASSVDGVFAWHENTAGDGSAWTEHVLGTDAGGARAIFAADFDGDLDPEVVTGASTGDLSWYGNLSPHPRVFCATTTIEPTTAGIGPQDALAVDIDGDGDQDAVLAEHLGEVLAWHENTAGDGSAWTEHVVKSGLQFSSVDATDLDGDGRMDLVAYSGEIDSLRFFEFTGQIWLELPIENSIQSILDVEAADLDGDGDGDVIAAQSSTDTCWVYRREPGFSNWSKFAVSSNLENVQGVCLADVDGDGRLDVLAAAYGDDKVSLLLQTAPDLTHWVERIVDGNMDGPSVVRAGDVDGDGDLDVLSAELGNRRFAWHENLEPTVSELWDDHEVAAGSGVPVDADLADVDRDGDLDVLTAYSIGDGYSWYENLAGTGTGWLEHAIVAENLVTSSIVATDVDGDGDLDALSGTLGGPGLAWHENVNGHLVGCPDSISLSAGGAQVFTLDFGAEHGIDMYQVIGSASGTSPGLPGPTPIPLNFDAYMQFTIQFPNVLILNSLSFLDPLGRGTAALAFPPGSDPSLAGIHLDHAYVVIDFPGTGQILQVSHTVPLDLTP